MDKNDIFYKSVIKPARVAAVGFAAAKVICAAILASLPDFRMDFCGPLGYPAVFALLIANAIWVGAVFEITGSKKLTKQWIIYAVLSITVLAELVSHYTTGVLYGKPPFRLAFSCVWCPILAIIAAFITVRAALAYAKSRDEAQAATRAKSEFLARMSHEIRTPVNAITGMAELAMREEMSAAAQEHIVTIKQASASLLSIINDILDISRIESGKLEIIPAEYRLAPLINDVISIIRTRVADSSVRFVASVDCRLPNSLYGDEIRIKQVLLNILGNAAKYTKVGSISFSVSGVITNENTVILTVRVADTGKGIKREDVDKLFNSFVRVDMANVREAEGTGLGLSITKNLLNAMGGDIGVESEYDRGSVFTVTLPQEVRSHEPLAAVDSASDRSVLLYDRREVYADSVAGALNNLGVGCAHVTSDQELHEALKAGSYSFAFIEPALLARVKKTLSELNSRAKVVLLTNVGNAAIEKGVGVLTMPAHSISVANMLNGVAGAMPHADERVIVRFNAPDARALIVDDINTNIKVAAGLLSPYKMQIDPALSGAEAIEAVKANKYDIIFMDYMMPEMNGITATKRIRELGGEYEKLPIVALTANAISGAEEMFLANGFNGFLSKPIDRAKLNAILGRWIPAEKQVEAEEEGVSHEEVKAKVMIKTVDVKLGLERTGGTLAAYMQTLAMFKSDARGKMAEIRQALEEGNMPRYVTHIHALKSAAANIGATELSGAAKLLEKAGMRVDREYVSAHTPRLLKNLESLLNGIDKAVSADREAAQAQDRAGTDRDTLKSALANLRRAISDVDPHAINEAVRELETFEKSAEIGGAVENILRNVLGGKYGDAAPLIDALERNA